MKIENLYEGQVFKNYKEICMVLGMEIKDGTNSKKAQFTTLSQYCNFIKNGHKIIIVEIHSTKQKRDDNRGGARNYYTVPLSESNPKLARQWNIEKNGELTDDITRRTCEWYWWNCDVCNEESFLPPIKRFHSSKSPIDDNITCPYCWLSKGAKRIYKVLMKYNISFRNEYTFNDLIGMQGNKLRFDFAIVDKENTVKALIEFDGAYHDDNEVYEIHDKLKDDYCITNNIPLLRIHHTDSDLIEAKTVKFLNVFENKGDKLELLVDRNMEIKKQIRVLQEELLINQEILHKILN